MTDAAAVQLKEGEEEELSEEDKALKENLEMLVARAKDVDRGVAKVAIEAIGTEIRWV